MSNALQQGCPIPRGITGWEPSVVRDRCGPKSHLSPCVSVGFQLACNPQAAKNVSPGGTGRWRQQHELHSEYDMTNLYVTLVGIKHRLHGGHQHLLS